MQNLKTMPIKNWLLWKFQSSWSHDVSVKIFPEDFQETSPSLVVKALIVMKLNIFKVGAGLRSPSTPVLVSYELNIFLALKSYDKKEGTLNVSSVRFPTLI